MTRALLIKLHLYLSAFFSAAIILVAVSWGDHTITLVESVILFALIIGYVSLLGILAQREKDDPSLAELTDLEHMDGLPKSLGKSVLTVIVGLVALPVGAQMIVVGGSHVRNLRLAD